MGGEAPREEGGDRGGNPPRKVGGLPRLATLGFGKATPADYSGLRPLGFFGGLAPQTPLNGSSPVFRNYFFSPPGADHIPSKS